MRWNAGIDSCTPGMLQAHYAPGKPLRLVPQGFAWSGEQGKEIQSLPWMPAEGIARALTTKGNPAEAAQRLFAELRAFAASDAKELWVEMAPEEGLGRAINDRLRRAAHCGED